jgi:hypothetical protein
MSSLGSSSIQRVIVVQTQQYIIILSMCSRSVVTILSGLRWAVHGHRRNSNKSDHHANNLAEPDLECIPSDVTIDSVEHDVKELNGFI